MVAKAAFEALVEGNVGDSAARASGLHASSWSRHSRNEGMAALRKVKR